MRKNLNMRKSGFSLMELIIVIVIIGILIGAVVGLSSQREVAKVSAAEQMIAQTITSTNGWAALQGQDDFTPLNVGAADEGTGYEILKANGSLPANFTPKKMHPWNGTAHVYSLGDGSGGIKGVVGGGTVGAFTSSAGNLQNHFVIELNNLPTFACTALNNKFKNKHYIDVENGYPDKLSTLDEGTGSVLNPCTSTTSENTWLLLQ